MSIDATRIICTGCHYSTYETYRPLLLRYRSQTGEEFTSYQTKGWCYHCNTYSSLESLNRDDITQDIQSQHTHQQAALQELTTLQRDWLSRLKHRHRIHALNDELANLQKELTQNTVALNYLQQRQSSPRCLNCWHDNTTPLHFNQQRKSYHTPHGEFIHECGGRLYCINEPSGPRFHYQRITITLNHEGLPLEE